MPEIGVVAETSIGAVNSAASIISGFFIIYRFLVPESTL
jgi:hypothetical protein